MYVYFSELLIRSAMVTVSFFLYFINFCSVGSAKLLQSFAKNIPFKGNAFVRTSERLVITFFIGFLL